jgi:hypothetical protein
MAMSAGLPISRREHTSEGTDVIELDTKAAAPADHVTPVNVQRQLAGRKSSAAYKLAKKISDSKRRAAKRVSDSKPISDAPGPFA